MLKLPCVPAIPVCPTKPAVLIKLPLALIAAAVSPSINANVAPSVAVILVAPSRTSGEAATSAATVSDRL